MTTETSDFKRMLGYSALTGLFLAGVWGVDRMSSNPILSFNRVSAGITDLVTPKTAEEKAAAEFEAFLKPMQDQAEANRKDHCGDRRTGTASYPFGRDGTAHVSCANGSIQFTYK